MAYRSDYTPGTTLEEIYQNQLGRAPDPGGLDYYQRQVVFGYMTFEEARQAIIASEEAQRYRQIGRASCRERV